MKITDEQIIEILDLTTFENTYTHGTPPYKSWREGHDTDLGTTESLIAKIREILERPNVEIPKSHCCWCETCGERHNGKKQTCYRHLRTAAMCELYG